MDLQLRNDITFYYLEHSLDYDTSGCEQYLSDRNGTFWHLPDSLNMDLREGFDSECLVDIVREARLR